MRETAVKRIPGPEDAPRATVGRVSGEEGPMHVPTPAQRCEDCKGRGRRQPKGHKIGCACFACKPCSSCDGTGFAAGRRPLVLR